MKTFYANKKGEFIFIKLKNFYNKKEIIIKYIVLYIYKKNSIAKHGQKIIMIIKNTFLINNKLLLEFWAKAINNANYL